MKIGLFIPCFVNELYPQVAVATLKLLENLHQNDNVVPGVAVDKIRCTTPATLLPALCLAFTADGSTLVTSTTRGSVQVLCVGAKQMQVQHTFEARSGMGKASLTVHNNY